MNEKIQIPNFVINSFKKIYAGYLAVTDARRDFYLYQSIQYLLQDPKIRELLIKKGHNIKKIEKIINKNYSKTSQVKFYIDQLGDKTIEKEDINNPYLRNCLEIQRKIPIMTTQAFQILYEICLNTTLEKLIITKEDMRTYELDHKKIEYGFGQKQKEIE